MKSAFSNRKNPANVTLAASLRASSSGWYGFLNSFPLPYPPGRSCSQDRLAACTQSEKSSNTKNNRFNSETATKRMQSSERQFLTFLLTEIKMKNKQFYSKYTAVLVWVIGGGHETSFESDKLFFDHVRITAI